MQVPPWILKSSFLIEILERVGDPIEYLKHLLKNNCYDTTM